MTHWFIPRNPRWCSSRDDNDAWIAYVELQDVKAFLTELKEMLYTDVNAAKKLIDKELI